MEARKAFVLVLTILTIIAGTTMPAASSGGERASRVDAVEAPATATLRSMSGTRVAASLLEPLVFQYGCYGQTDRPHLSSHVPGTVNVVARTVCPGESVYVQTSLYRDRWYGPQFLDSGSNSGFGSTSTNAAWNCSGSGTYTYRAYSYHEATVSGWAYTSNSARLTC